MDTASMTMAFVAESNLVRILEIEPDWNRMQYGADCVKRAPAAAKTKEEAVDHNLTAALTLNPATSSYEEEDTEQTAESAVDVDSEQTSADLLAAERKKGPKSLHTLSGHSGFILAMEYSDGIVVTMASDRTLCVWSGQSGRRMASVSNIPGTFIPGYPYIVRRAKKEQNKVFYTSDDGIFMVVF